MSEKITKPCRIGGVTFQVGVSVDTVIKASQRLYESQLNNPEKPLVEMKEIRKLIMGTHVLVAKEPKKEIINALEKGFHYDFADTTFDSSEAYKAMIEEVEKENAK